MSGKLKRKFVSIETKLEVLKRLDNGETIKKLALEFGVGVVTVGDWRRNRANIEKWCLEKSCENMPFNCRKTMKKTQYEKTSESLFVWFSQQRLKGHAITGRMLQQKALELHKQHKDGDSEFNASVGWLDRWKKRYGIQLNAHNEGLAALEAALRYVEQQEEATSNDIMILKKWRDYAFHKQMHYQKQYSRESICSS